ncbi:hypothetical protein QBC37DRAFT_407233 [Rhypophila decipiens]|uniref:Uncharacterized protein n=1 Tax=Rhypophila decipiens TaxID=261697 RepID=A0AAN6XZ38_9PEZI|nr:hypothetical protein QBC37DRAFT_407233 [Rhypophila decipiens]
MDQRIRVQMDLRPQKAPSKGDFPAAFWNILIDIELSRSHLPHIMDNGLFLQHPRLYLLPCDRVLTAKREWEIREFPDEETLFEYKHPGNGSYNKINDNEPRQCLRRLWPGDQSTSTSDLAAVGYRGGEKNGRTTGAVVARDQGQSGVGRVTGREHGGYQRSEYWAWPGRRRASVGVPRAQFSVWECFFPWMRQNAPNDILDSAVPPLAVAKDDGSGDGWESTRFFQNPSCDQLSEYAFGKWGPFTTIQARDLLAVVVRSPRRRVVIATP